MPLKYCNYSWLKRTLSVVKSSAGAAPDEAPAPERQHDAAPAPRSDSFPFAKIIKN
jgi:hypothetical protein